jgi:hypothetical protein
MRLVIRNLGIMLFLCLSLLTCRYLPYDKGEELAAQLASTLTLEGTISPFFLSNLCYNSGKEGLTFIPEKESYSSGFIADWVNDGHVRLWYVWNNAGSYSVSPQSLDFYANNPPSSRPNWFAETISGAPGYLFYCHYNYDSMGSQTASYNIIHFDMPSNAWPLPMPESDFISKVGGGASAINGAFIHPETGLLYVLYTTGSYFAEANFTIDMTGLSNRQPTRSSSPANSDSIKSDFFYSYDPDSTTAVVSYYVSGTLHNLTWQGTSPAVASPFPANRPLSRILSNKNLLSFDGTMCYGYNLAGSGIYEFPTGDMRLIYEKQDSVSLKYILVYSIANRISSNGNNCDATYAADVYSYPTADLNY